MDKQGIERVIDHVTKAIDAAPRSEAPFVHLTFQGIFPPDIYEEMLKAMPGARDYRALPGRGGSNLKEDGTSTRVKMDLFPEYIRNLPAEKRKVWSIVGKALCSTQVRDAFMRKLEPGLKKRFGDKFSTVGMYPIPVLTRDIPGYRIKPHTDTHWKGITVQLYLPKDEEHTNIGTIFHGKDANGKLTRDKQMRFAPNTGYAFAVTDDSWHSADPVDATVDTRDSILLTYFVDHTPLRKLRNRFKRAGNFVLDRAKGLTRH
jgi:hypothetical protein